ncbi:MAG: anthranilate phosphoribosyltransferase [Dermabacter sp.]|nr:anthranilate phosphoribosyltransferase [Dermabacter sp.]
MSSESAHTWPALISSLLAGRDLDAEAVQWAMDEVMSGEAPPAALAGFLVALESKGAGVQEVKALADTMLAHARPLTAPVGAVDIVGTGGDGVHSVNISTMSAIVIGGAGYPVVKHGNRASSSRSGSADVLDELGVRLDVPVERVEQIAHEVGITFCFAQTFHPSMRFAVEARRSIAVPTVFNVLGPLTNPGRVQANAIGVASARLAPVLAGVFAERGGSALVFRGQDGLDELSIAGASDVWEVRDGSILTHEVHPSDVGLDAAGIDTLRGGSPAFNADVARAVFAGHRGPVRDAVVLNSAAGIVAARGLRDGLSADQAKDSFVDRMREAAREAEASIDSGAAERLLVRWAAATQQQGASQADLVHPLPVI